MRQLQNIFGRSLQGDGAIVNGFGHARGGFVGDHFLQAV